MSTVVHLVDAAEIARGPYRQSLVAVFGLEVDAIDFPRTRSVDVRRQLITLAWQAPYLDAPKTTESERVVPLAQVTLDAIAAHPAAYPARTVTIN